MKRFVLRCDSDIGELGYLPPLIARLLVARGISTREEAEDYLNPREALLNDPLLLRGMERAAARLREAAARGERVAVYGDYDVDGVCACAILVPMLKALGAQAEEYIPSRHSEGYGLNDAAVRALAERGFTLLLTVDCGVTAISQVALAKSLGMEVIVTDHHRPGDSLPDCPVINPLLGEYPCPCICGAAVAYKLAEALSPSLAARCRDLAALATVADVVPLTGENRVIVKLGLNMINSGARPGIEALAESAGLKNAVTASGIAFQLAPRLNASGRVGDARRAYRLLSTADENEARALARELEEENVRRRAIEAKILAEARALLADFDFVGRRAVVLAGEDWNPGVIGLCAARVAQEYGYPTILLTEAGEGGELTGSCRSVPGVDIYEALKACDGVLLRYGGHRQAAGLALERARLDEFRELLDGYLREEIPPETYCQLCEYDADARLADFTPEAVEALSLMQPTGMGNPGPVFRVDCAVSEARAVGREGAHLKLRLRDGGRDMGGIAFGAGARAGELALSGARAMLVTPAINEWRGERNVECEVRVFADAPSENTFAAFEAGFDVYLREFLTEMLYNSELISSPDAPPVEALEERLSRERQGTLIAALTLEGARELKALAARRPLDVFVGAWPSDARAYNALALCPRGRLNVRYRRVVFWDAPREAFGDLPDGCEALSAGRRYAGSWLGDAPDVARLREIYRAFRTPPELGAATPETLMAAALFERAGLAARTNGGRSCALLPPKKCDIASDPLYTRFARLRAYALGG